MTSSTISILLISYLATLAYMFYKTSDLYDSDLIDQDQATVLLVMAFIPFVNVLVSLIPRSFFGRNR